ncbi:MAG: hydrogenase nickel incorporation protein HypB [Myxococcota bacterium]|nr:hydrogenase nickel incorporation protein HypB [Myxococcota bacterium]
MCDHCGCDPSEGQQATNEKIVIEQDVLAHNRHHAERIRKKLASRNVKLLNIVGSPGCGKTELLTGLIPKLRDRHHCVVIEGDLATDNDAKRIAATGAPVFQVETGTACHLTAHDIEHALSHLPLSDGCLAIIENVGNLVCPSMFDLGESLRMVCLSVAEGTDKPQKYPVSFREAHLVVITKNDLTPYVDFDTSTCLRMIDEITPSTPCVVTSSRGGEGLAELVSQIEKMWEH